MQTAVVLAVITAFEARSSLLRLTSKSPSRTWGSAFTSRLSKNTFAGFTSQCQMPAAARRAERGTTVRR